VPLVSAKPANHRVRVPDDMTTLFS
jgi:hypothetical protein